MKRVPFYQVDAFTNKQFSGNPAIVCVLDEWLSDFELQSISAENNLSETAFLVSKLNYYELRWFTPIMEVSLCGHGTLAAAFIILNDIEPYSNQVTFQTKSGKLITRKEGNIFSMYFPSFQPNSCRPVPKLVRALGKQPIEVLTAQNHYLIVYKEEEDILSIHPDSNLLCQLEHTGIIITAKGNSCDFVSRYFAPAEGISEDPVTGSSHCILVPYWADKLKKKYLHALQLSTRGGELFCELTNNQTIISGKAVKYSEGVILLQDTCD